jgi:hypothetical protein
MDMILSVSIDLDPLRCYREIYGLPRRDGPDPVTAVAAGRFRELMDEIGMRGTLFVVGDTLGDPAAVEALGKAVAEGHEIGNHSFSHRYDLFRQDAGAIEEEIGKGAAAVEDHLGVRPNGFRAPGYMLGTRVLPSLVKLGARYDSSVLPSPLYQGAKTVAIGWLRLRGRVSGSRIGDIREATGPRRPYRPDLEHPWNPGDAPLLELPVSTVLGLPLTGATLHLFGPSRVGWFAAFCDNLAFVHLELHGVDLMDLVADGLDPALGAQADLRIPRERKMQTIVAFARRLLRNHKAMTLGEVAELLW